MNQPGQCEPWEHRLSRRKWLGTAAGAAAFAQSAAWLRGQTPVATDKQVLFIWIDGGMSQFESWDPKPGTDFGGPFRPIATTVPDVQFSELVPLTAQQAQHLVVVRNMSTQDNSHSAGVPRIQRGDPKNRGVIYPFFGSAVSHLLGPGQSGLPPYVSIKPGSGGFYYQDAGFLGPKFGALAFGDGKPPENILLHPSLTDAEDVARNDLRQKLNRRYAERRQKTVSEANDYVYEMAGKLMRRQDLFDMSSFTPAEVQRYGTHEMGRHLLQARRMLEAGVRFVKVTSYGWDTHADNFNAHRSLMGRFDQAYSAIIEDLAQRGMLDHVLVVAMSEFGRTPKINGSVGRDHWPESWSLLLSGCGLKRGVTVGKTTPNGSEVDGAGYDIGHMFHTWFRCLGVDSQLTEYDNHGQPLPIAHDGCAPVLEVLA